MNTVLSGPYIIFTVIFWAVVFGITKLLSKRKENVVLYFPFLVMFRWKVLNSLFRKIARKTPRLWRLWWNIGMIISFAGILYALYFFFNNFIQLIFAPQIENAIIPIIPGVTVSFDLVTQIALPILFAVTIHEFSHAIAAEIDGLDVKSSGIFAAGVFFPIGFGAFVELDEFQTYSPTVKRATRLRIYSAGVWSNIVTAGILFLLLLNFAQAMNFGYSAESERIVEVSSDEEGGYNEGNIYSGDIILAINGTMVDERSAFHLTSVLHNDIPSFQVKPGDMLNLTCYNASKDETYFRMVNLGARKIWGALYSWYNSSAIQLSTVYGFDNGGNNAGTINAGDIITNFAGEALNRDEGISPSQILREIDLLPPFKVNITFANKSVSEIYIDYIPKDTANYYFGDIFTGLRLTTEDGKIVVTDNSQIPDDDNFDLPPEGMVIEAINGTNIPNNITHNHLRAFIEHHWVLNENSILILLSQNGTEYRIRCYEQPTIKVIIGIISESYWIYGNILGSFLGDQFPNQFRNFVQYTFLISISLALFNLLPTAIFDGGRLVKEFIEYSLIKIKKWKGKDDRWERDIVKKIRFDNSRNSAETNLQTYRITEIRSLSLLEYPEEEETKNDRKKGSKRGIREQDEEMITHIPLDFSTRDTNGDGHADTVIFSDPSAIQSNSIIEAEVVCTLDKWQVEAKKINKVISWFVGLVLLGSFILSIGNFGTSILAF